MRINLSLKYAITISAVLLIVLGLVLKANLDLYGFELVLAESWSKAQDALNKQLPALIILFLMLPDGDGVEICKDLKQ